MPPRAQAFVATITYDVETDAQAALGAPRLPWRDTAVALAGQVAQYRLENEARWMHFNERVLSILNQPSVASCQDAPFDIEVDPTGRRGRTLAMPKPDLAFGLAPDMEEGALGPLACDSLQHLPERLRIHAFPSTSPNAPKLVFPWLIFEAKSEHGTMFEAQNQAAHGAAKALAIMRTLREGYERTLVALVQEAPSLPVVVVCSQGHLWEVSVAFDLYDQVAAREDGSAPSAMQMVSIWASSIASTKGMLHLQSPLYRLLLWMLGTWRSAILGMLGIIKATTSSEPAAQLGQLHSQA